MLDIAFVCLLDFLVRNQLGPEQEQDTPERAIIISDENTKDSKAEAASRLVTDLLRFPNPEGD